ncbi:MAG TPA: CDP-glycerol glycerophosphotransferase family protein [Tepidisphaeraceae bacterium]|nr:CDP-glycerol glycerophosphotransferase family protein [Tepidisphaeraceae bacterium]
MHFGLIVRVGFYKYRPFHDLILRPVYDLLRDRCRCALSDDIAALADFRPHVVVLSESIVGTLRPRFAGDTVFVHTRHGLASKNVAHGGAAETDYLCVTSDAVRDEYAAAGAVPRRGFWVTGYVQMDPLHRAVAAGVRPPLPPRLGAVPSGHKLVLYAPTLNDGLSSAPMLGDRTLELLKAGRSDVTVVVKPHPLTRQFNPHWLGWWEAAAARDGRLRVADDPRDDVMPLLAAADVLVTDASSVALQFLATGRPMVLISNPRRFDCEHYDPQGLEWRWRDMGAEAHGADDVPAAVDECLDDPGRRAARRKEYAGYLFGTLTDGRAAERIAENIMGLAGTCPRDDVAFAAAWPVRIARRAVRVGRRAATLRGWMA